MFMVFFLFFFSVSLFQDAIPDHQFGFHVLEAKIYCYGIYLDDGCRPAFELSLSLPQHTLVSSIP